MRTNFWHMVNVRDLYDEGSGDAGSAAPCPQMHSHSDKLLACGGFASFTTQRVLLKCVRIRASCHAGAPDKGLPNLPVA